MSRLGRSRGPGGREPAARRAGRGRRPAAVAGRAWCRPAARPGRCAGCRTRARGTCGPPRGSEGAIEGGSAAGAGRGARRCAASASSRRDVLLLDHAVEHVVAALRSRAPGGRSETAAPGSGASRRGGPPRRGVRSPIGLPKKKLAGRLDAVVAVAEVDLVAVEGEDLLLGEALLDLEGEDDLLDLALVGLLGGEEEQAGELHGQGREALRRGVRSGGWRARRRGMRQGLMPDVLPEVGVLDGHDRVAQHRGDVLEADDDAPLDRELADQAAVGREDLGDDVRLEVLERGDLGQVALVGEEDADERAAQDGDGEEGGDDDAPQGEDAGGRHHRSIMTDRPAVRPSARCRGSAPRRRETAWPPPLDPPSPREGREALPSARGPRPAGAVASRAVAPEAPAAPCARPVAAARAFAAAAAAGSRRSLRRCRHAGRQPPAVRRSGAGPVTRRSSGVCRRSRGAIAAGHLAAAAGAQAGSGSVPSPARGRDAPRRSSARRQPRSEDVWAGAVHAFVAARAGIAATARPARGRRSSRAAHDPRLARCAPARAACTAGAGRATVRPGRRLSSPPSSPPVRAPRDAVPRPVRPRRAANRSRASRAPGSSSCCPRRARARSRRESAAG